MGLAALTSPELIFPHLPGSDPPTVLKALADRIEACGRVASAEELYSRLWEREQLGSTGIGHGVAVPHCKMAEQHSVLLALGVSDKPVAFGAVDDEPVRLFFVLVSPADAPAEHLHALAAISKWVRADRNVERLLELDEGKGMFVNLLGKTMLYEYFGALRSADACIGFPAGNMMMGPAFGVPTTIIWNDHFDRRFHFNACRPGTDYTILNTKELI